MENQFSIDAQDLEGKDVGYKYKIINSIIKKLTDNEYSNSEVEEFLRTWTYTDCPSMILYLSLINFTRNSRVVIQCLNSENDALVRRTIRICTFFWADRTYNLEFYIKNIFPYLSHSNRNHLLKALAVNLNDEKMAEAFFEYAKHIYGNSAARPFLIYCSTNFIVNILKHRVVLTLTEIKILTKKDSTFIAKYVSNLFNFKRNESRLAKLVHLLDSKALLHNCILVDTEETLQIIDNNKKWLCFNGFGRRITKLILKTNKSIILKDPKYYKGMLKRSVLFKCLTKEDYEIFYKGLFPKEISIPDPICTSWDASSAWEVLFSYLDYYKTKADKRKLLLYSYKNVYNEDLLSDSKNITPKILELLDTEQRIQFARKKIEKCDSSNIYEWTAYLTCNEAIPVLKQEIYITSDPNKRLKYLEHMSFSCHINNDMKSMLDVLKYFNHRHRNEESYIKASFLRFLQDNIDLKQFTLEHWEQIREIVAVAAINGDLRSYYGLESVFKSPIKYCLDNNFVLTSYLKLYMEWARSWCYSELWNLFQNNTDYERRCLFLIGELIPGVFLDKSDTTEINTIIMNFLDSIKSWNKRHPNDMISALDFERWTVDCIRTVLTSKIDYQKQELISYFGYDDRSAAYFNEELKHIEYDIDIYQLKNTFIKNPELTMKQIKEVYKGCSSSRFIKAHLMPLLKSKKINGVDKLKENIKLYFLKVAKYVISNDEDKSGDLDFEEQKKLMPGVIKFLSHFLSADEFYTIVKPFYPKTSRIDLTDTASTSSLYEIQKAIAISLKNYAGVLDTFEALRVFCAGDYLQLTVGSLNSVCVKSPIYKAVQFLNSCIDVPVSFKKHVIRLLCLLSDKIFVKEFLQNLWITETNPSIRQTLLKHVFHVFTEEPDESSWILIENCINSLSVKDKNSLNKIFKYEDIPDNYLSQCILLTWEMLTKLPASGELKSHKIFVLNSVNNDLNFVSDEVVQKLLQGEIFRPDVVIMHSICNLAANYILAGTNVEIQELRMNSVFHEMKTSFAEFWDFSSDEDSSFVTRKSINYFIETLCLLSVNNEKYKETSEFVLSSLIAQLNLIFDPSIFIYSSYMMIRFFLVLKQGATPKEFGFNIKPLIEEEIVIHGIYIINVLSHILNDFVSRVDQNVMEVVYGLLREPIQSMGCIYLALDIVNMAEIFEPKNKSILNQLKKFNDKKINIMLNMFN